MSFLYSISNAASFKVETIENGDDIARRVIRAMGHFPAARWKIANPEYREDGRCQLLIYETKSDAVNRPWAAIGEVIREPIDEREDNKQ